MCATPLILLRSDEIRRLTRAILDRKMKRRLRRTILREPGKLQKKVALGQKFSIHLRPQVYLCLH